MLPGNNVKCHVTLKWYVNSYRIINDIYCFCGFVLRNLIKGTSKNRFEKGKWVECAECDESRRSKAVCLTRRFEEAGGVLYTFSLKQGF